MIMVDELRALPGRKSRPSRWCRLTCDGDPSELHLFAGNLGIGRHWFQESPLPHYLLTPQKRALALICGAAFVPAIKQAQWRAQDMRGS